jgi:iron complex outermembrane receptor protein
MALAMLVPGGLPALAQEPAPPRLAPIVVTPSRLEQEAGEAPASVTVIEGRDVRESPSQTVDDLLRQVPSFSLFRRSSSMVTHPTAQGVSLRGIGPSGASRALVLYDDVPVNDPFGGWVYWSRLPLLAIDRIEVVRGGGSALWGNGALGGVIDVVSRRATASGVTAEISRGSFDTTNVDVLGTVRRGPLGATLEGRWFDTGGYDTVLASRRGRIDIPADSRDGVFNGRTELRLSPDASVFAAGAFLDEARGNGTPLQANDTQLGAFAAGGTLRTAGGSEWRATAWTQAQTFHSTFSSQADDRGSETLALDQHSPSTTAGGSLVWHRAFRDHTVLAGGDVRWVDGETSEKVYSAGTFLRTRIAGGEQVLAGVFAQDVWRPAPAWQIVGGVRADAWLSYHGTRRDTPPPAGVPARQVFSDTTDVIPSPRLSALWRATPSTDVEASVYQGFRVPTLNELYRLFRVRNDVTVANATLRPERLTGGELGLAQRLAPVTVRVTPFWNEVTDQVLNVTQATLLPDCPAGTTCRQRQNVDLTRIRGVESEVEVRLAAHLRLLAAHVYTDARVVTAAGARDLEGKRLAQVPEHVMTAGLRWYDPRWLDVTLLVRRVGEAFEDDLNTLPLGAYTTVDLRLSKRLGRHMEAFVAFENLLDETYAVARTSEGVVSVGAPFGVHGGLRVGF